MNTKKPLILISNDDGYHAKGINSLIDMLRDIADIIVCAPESARSGFATAFSATIPLRLKLRRDEVGMQMWSCNGTPVDCVKIALQELFADRLPDMILGGINHGDNASVNVHYSGTMGVTLEGCMKYIPSIGFSLCDFSSDADFEPLRPYVRQIVQKVLNEGLPKGVCLNVNFPKLTEFKGIKVCRMAMVQRMRKTAPSARLRLLLDDWLLPQRRAGAGGHRQLGAHAWLHIHHTDTHRCYRL